MGGLYKGDSRSLDYGSCAGSILGDPLNGDIGVI